MCTMCLTLDSICDDWHGALSEGRCGRWRASGPVVEGFSFDRVRPWIVVLEATAPKTPNDASARWEELLVSRGYKFVYFDALNRFYPGFPFSQ